ncbi:MAG: hypothetical protein ABR587_15150, partial [Candidatus Binatia bacterium]
MDLQGDDLICAGALPTKTSMTGFSCMRARSRSDEVGEVLRFPVPKEPLRSHPPATVERILAASAEMLPVWNADPQQQERRLARKCHQRFTLRTNYAGD